LAIQRNSKGPLIILQFKVNTVRVPGQKYTDCEAPRPDGRLELFYRRSAAAARFIQTMKRFKTQRVPNVLAVLLGWAVRPSFEV